MCRRGKFGGKKGRNALVRLILAITETIGKSGKAG